MTNLDREEIELWQRVIVAHTSCENAGGAASAIKFADAIIRARRARFKAKKGDGPFR